jgi:hypothetical protein
LYYLAGRPSLAPSEHNVQLLPGHCIIQTND